MRHASILLALSACGDARPAPPGPITGPIARFVVDSITLPRTNTEARALGDDLNGDRTTDNQLGMVIGSLQIEHDLTTHGDDMLAAGAIATVVEIQADDVANDPTVEVTLTGAPGEDATPMYGAFTGGALQSIRTRDGGFLGAATLHLPVFADADPTALPVDDLEIELTPDGHGGYDALVHGAVAEDAARSAALAGLVQMLAGSPQDHVELARYLDIDPADGTISSHELANSTIVTTLLVADLTFDGRLAMSIGLGIHLLPCADGGCARPITDTCHDRVRDGDETDVDCGGTCRGCAAAAHCTLAADCQSHACGTDGTCAAPSCDDGVHDGFEAGIDCGWTGCPACH